MVRISSASLHYLYCFHHLVSYTFIHVVSFIEVASKS